MLLGGEGMMQRAGVALGGGPQTQYPHWDWASPKGKVRRGGATPQAHAHTAPCLSTPLITDKELKWVLAPGQPLVKGCPGGTGAPEH